MWICLNNAFLSIVAHRTKPDTLLVRARVAGHIEEVFGPTVKVFTDQSADYFYRAEVGREFVAVVIGTNVRNISYGNFKDSVKDNDLHDAYSGFWSIMYRLQSDMKRKVGDLSKSLMKRRSVQLAPKAKANNVFGGKAK